MPLVAVPEVPPAIRWIRDRVVPVGLAVVLVVVLVWNAASVGVVDLPDSTPVDESPDPRWNMFAPTPLDTDLWFVAPATLDSGERVDALRGGSVTWTKPPDVAASYPTARWRKYLTNVYRTDSTVVSVGLAAHLCHRLSTSDRDPTAVAVDAVRQPTRLEGSEPTERVRLADRTCANT